MGGIMIDWLKAAWADLIQVLKDILQAILDFFLDIGILVLELILDAIYAIVNLIPVPSFLQNGMGSMLSGIDPSVLYFLDQSGLDAAFALLGTGIAFRLIRKLITLGQW